MLSETLNPETKTLVLAHGNPKPESLVCHSVANAGFFGPNFRRNKILGFQVTTFASSKAHKLIV